MKVIRWVVTLSFLLLFYSVNAYADLLAHTYGDAGAMVMSRSSAGDMVGSAGFSCGDAISGVDYPVGTPIQVYVNVGVSGCKAKADIMLGDTRIIGTYIPFDADMYYPLSVIYQPGGPLQVALYDTDCQSAYVRILDCRISPGH